jgi:uncharacterized protein (TIGR00251 family)
MTQRRMFRTLHVDSDGRSCCEVDVIVQPRASRSGVVGVHGDRLKIAVTAPPVDGEANAAVIAVVAAALGVPKRDVAVVRGATGRRKTLRIAGVDPGAVEKLCAP